MKVPFFLSVLLLSSSISAQRVLSPTQKFISAHCTSGKAWRQDCNFCTCSATGELACTKMGCVSYKDCTPGARWWQECGECFCDDFGRSVCYSVSCRGRW